ncbi:hypothetical protein GCK72_013654 [Caenorhabditis remanei]|uniref:Uncharacterized protein n=1 Tax=Caenorhabditis remanei TaxID=31234 RepID=A0A6A5GRV2_CAERE|nr:hypothetical protein GCK72_013654 [Caenorhabditis remanei]KAF1757199.1 hypothetical protein GCK72_013654 [Caenorhabditis remanei]
MRRGGAPSKPAPQAAPAPGLPPELRPKFPRFDEFAPVEQPQTPQTPQTPPPQTPVEVDAPMKTLEGDAADNVPVDADGQNQEVPSKDVETPDAQKPKKKKKEKPKKVDDGTAVAVFVDDDEAKKDEGNNAVGLFVDDDEDEKKPKKKERKDRPRAGPTEKEKDSNRDKGKEGKDKDNAKVIKRQKQPKTESLRQKGKPTNQSNRQKKNQASMRKVNAAKAPNPVQQPPPAAKVAPKQAAPPAPLPAAGVAVVPAPPVKPAGQPGAVDPRAPKIVAPVAKDPNEGFLKAMYAKAKQKIAAMSKNPNYVPTSDTAMAEDTLVATDEAIIKPEITAVYGTPLDYPKGVLPPKSDKYHPDKLFPGGRPFWMNRSEKPPQAKVIMIGEVEARLKAKTIKFEPPIPRTEPFTPYCQDFQLLKRTDEQFSQIRVLRNTARSCCIMKTHAIEFERTKKVIRPKTGKRLPNRRNPPVLPTYCQTYTRKQYKKKPVHTKKPLVFGTKGKKIKAKKKDSNSCSIAD